jgi:Cu2+-exporting ATPase
MLTGESRPIEKIKGQEAVGGAINGEGAVILEVHKTGDEIYLPIAAQFWALTQLR